MEKIITQCSNCKAQYKLSGEKVGKRIKCPKCANIFVVKAQEAPTVGKIITQCSKCKAQFKLGGEKVGRKIKCPKCANIFVVEERKATPKSAPEAPPAPPVAEQSAAPAVEKVLSLKERPRPLQVSDFFETQHTRFIPEKSEGVQAHISYNITGDGGGEWTLVVDNGTCEIRPGPDPSAKSQVRMTAKTYLKLAQGKLDGRVAFMLGKIKIKGDKSSLATVRECFQVPEL